MKISVVTPVYNGEKFIEACIQNVIDQHCHNVEHIILDACSTDRTVEIIKQYAEEYSHILWISEKDQGQSDAMNKGIAMANGNILGFLNVDDFYELNVLNRIVKIFESLPEPSLVVGNCNVEDEFGSVMFVNKPAKLKLAELLVGPEVNPWPINPAAYFYHKSLHEKIGLYDVNEHYALDLDFILRAVLVANINYVDEIWGTFRLIRGTKTYIDWETGQNTERCKSILEKYKNNLPDKIKKYFFAYILLQKIEHWMGYRKEPRLFFTVLVNKFNRKVRGFKKISG
jgi:glycosyltransferase involved in cell wall biosynthesis